jgi:hypothetical protein
MNHKLIIFVLRLSCFCLFMGRAWQHLLWDAPYRVIFWDEELMKPIVEGLFQTPWQSYATSLTVDENLTLLVRIIGIFYVICGLLSIAPQRILTIFRPILLLGSFSLMILAFLYTKDRFFQIGQLIEYASQVLAPAFLYYAVKSEEISDRLLFIMRMSIAFTFVGHGLYAAAYYPVPGNFIDMTINILHVKQPIATQILLFAGIMDFFVAALIFVPKIEPYFLIYAAIWGSVTSVARIVAFFDSTMPWTTISQWLPQTILRFPHAGIPICVFIAIGGFASLKKFAGMRPPSKLAMPA